MELIELYLKSQMHKVLTLDIKEKMLSHAYLVVSKDDLLLNEFCMLGIKEIYCLGDNPPCNNCVNCNKVEHGNMVDLEVYPKDDKNLVVEDIEKIVESAYIRPMESAYKIFYLKNFDKCTTQGQNKILKTIEEPPQNVIFILSSSSLGGVLPTILSRSKKIEERVLASEDIAKYLVDKKIDNAQLISCMADGNLTTALKIAENKDAINIINLCADMLINLKTSKDILVYSSRILALKKDIPFFLDTLISMLRDVVVSVSSENIYFKNLKSKYDMLSKIYSPLMVEKITKKINEIYLKMEFNCNMTGVVDQLLLDILEVKFLCQK